jgi:hypothetical protein
MQPGLIGRAGLLILALTGVVPRGAAQAMMAAPASAPIRAEPRQTATPPRAIPSPVYGVTLDDISHLSEVVSSLQQLVHRPTARIFFDAREPPSSYAGPIQQLRSVSYIMGQIADSSVMSTYTVSSYRERAQQYVAALGNDVDLWEVGNEVNGSWLGAHTMRKIEAAYAVVVAAHAPTALTFFYEGEPSDPNNCISTANGGNDMFTWITTHFHLHLPPRQRPPGTETMRLGVNYILVSWYPEQCNDLQPDWSAIFAQLAAIFPNSKLGFGELGTATPQGGSPYEVNLINQFYPLAQHVQLPASYIGGYFWWYFAEEMVPTTATILFQVLNQAIQ